MCSTPSVTHDPRESHVMLIKRRILEATRKAYAVTSWSRLWQLVPVAFVMLVYFDNVIAVYTRTNPSHCTKHIESDIHFVRKKMALP